MEESIIKIVKDYECELWEKLMDYEEMFGEKNTITCRQRTRWSTIDDLLSKIYSELCLEKDEEGIE